MARALAALIATLCLLLLSAGEAGAKSPGYLITGGALGDYAGRFGLAEYLPGPSAERVEPPDPMPALAYDLYNSYGNLAVPYQMATGGPEFRYYPEIGLLRQTARGDWYRPAPDIAAALDAAVTEARDAKERGELERDPIVADFRARSLHEVTYWLRPMSLVPLDETYYASAPMGCGRLDACSTVTRPGEEFILQDFVETLRGPLLQSDGASAAYVIEYYGIVEPPYGGIGGILGFYSPPEGASPGRFWYDGYFHDQSTPYHETTPGFDAAVAAALLGERGSVPPPGAAVAGAQAREGRSFPVSTVAGAGAAAAAALAIGGAAALLTARRQAAGRTARPAS